MLRAEQHLNTLKTEVARWLDRETYALTVRRDAETGEDVCEISKPEPLPNMWGVMASEVADHFGAALDNAIHSLTVSHTGHELPKTAFPIFIDEDRFNREGRPKMRGISPACQTVVETVQPFRKLEPEANYLWAIQERWNANKHQALPLLEVWREAKNTMISAGGKGVEPINIKYGNPGPLKSGTEIARWTTRLASDGYDGYVNVKFQLTRDITLDVTRPPILSGKPLIDALKAMGDVAYSIICALEASHNSHLAAKTP
jgi:hypothetical protein